MYIPGKQVHDCGKFIFMLWSYLKIWDYELIFGCAVKTISSLGLCNPFFSTLDKVLSYIVHTISTIKMYFMKFVPPITEIVNLLNDSTKIGVTEQNSSNLY